MEDIAKENVTPITQEKSESGNLVNKYSTQQNKKTKLYVSLAAISVFAFMLFALLVPFRDQVLQIFYPKPLSHAAGIPISFTNMADKPLEQRNGISYSVLPRIKVIISSTLGLPKPPPTSSLAVAGAIYTLYYSIAEDSNSLNSAAQVSYLHDPIIVTYQFKNTAPGKKYIWVKFFASDGSTDTKSAEVDVLPASDLFGQGLVIPDNNTFVTVDHPNNLNPKGPMTVEAWVKINQDSPSNQGSYLVYKEASLGQTTSALYYLQYYNDTFTVQIGDSVKQVSGSASSHIPSQFIKTDVWHHIAGVYDGSKVNLYINGMLVSTNPVVSGYKPTDDTLPFFVNKFPGSGLQSPALTIDEVRVSNIARYTAPFSVPQAPFTKDNNDLLLWHLNGNFSDVSAGSNIGILTGNGSFVSSGITPDQIKSTPNFGRAASFTGDNQGFDIQHVANNQNLLDLQTFTVEGWFKWSGKGNYPQELVRKNQSQSLPLNNSYDIAVIPSSNKLSASLEYANGVHVINTQNILADNNWHHIALVNNSANKLQTAVLYVDGKMVGSVDSGGTGLIYGNGDLYFGRYYQSGVTTNNSFQGQIDEVRLSNTARYATNFTVPTLPLNTDSSVTGLWHFDDDGKTATGNNSTNGMEALPYPGVGFVDSTVPAK